MTARDGTFAKVVSDRAALKGVGLVDLRSLSTETLAQIYSSAVVGPGAEARFFATIRRILIERGYGKQVHPGPSG